MHHLSYTTILKELLLRGFIMHAILLQVHAKFSSLLDMDSEMLELLLAYAPWSLVLFLLQIV